MKLFSKILVLGMLCLLTSNSFAINPVSPEAYNLSTITIDEYLDFNFKQYESLVGQDLKLKDRVEFIATKKYIKYQLKHDNIENGDNFYAVAAGFSFSIGGFLLGFFLGLIGLLIVALLFSKPRKSAVISALIGMLVSGVLAGIVYSI